MIRRINSNKSLGNDYVLTDTQQSRQLGSNWNISAFASV